MKKLLLCLTLFTNHMVEAKTSSSDKSFKTILKNPKVKKELTEVKKAAVLLGISVASLYASQYIRTYTEKKIPALSPMLDITGLLAVFNTWYYIIKTPYKAFKVCENIVNVAFDDEEELKEVKSESAA